MSEKLIKWNAKFIKEMYKGVKSDPMNNKFYYKGDVYLFNIDTGTINRITKDELTTGVNNGYPVAKIIEGTIYKIKRS